MRILLVEPDIILAKIYQNTFERHGFKVSWARNAQDAICEADEAHPDIVVLEMQLATHSGAAFLYEFRSYADWQETPIILHTLIPPDSLQLFAETFAELKVTSVLYKPATSLRKLLSTVKDCATMNV